MPHYDYGSSGAYFITICVQNRTLFDRAGGGRLHVLNNIGRIVAEEWRRTVEIRPDIALDEFVAMPNHFHAIVTLKSSSRGVSHTPSEKLHSLSQPSATIVRGFKAATTRRINEIRQMPGAPAWQRNYYKHIIRNDHELERIREYIANNPAQWMFDRENPEKGVYQYAPTDGIASIFGGERP